MMRAVLNAAPMPDAMERGLWPSMRFSMVARGVTRTCMWAWTRHVSAVISNAQIILEP
jgi:hypothetical protein